MGKLYKSQWFENTKQTGNFTNGGKDTFDPVNRYIGIRLQQGVPLLDRDWNELEDIRRYEEVMLRQHYIGSGSPDNGFKISAADPPARDDFKIAKGRCMVDGFEAVNEPAGRNYVLYSEQNSDTYHLPGADRVDTVYLDVWIEEVKSGGSTDPLANPNDVGVETCIRHKVNWQVRVAEGASVNRVDPEHHHYYELAKITRKKDRSIILDSDIQDLREAIGKKAHFRFKDVINSILKGNLPSEPEVKLHEFTDGLAYYSEFVSCFEDTSGNIWLFWRASEEGRNFWCKKYTPSPTGGSWGANTQITIGTRDKAYLNFFEDHAGNVWLFWSTSDAAGNNFWCKRYSAGRWDESDTQLTLTTGTAASQAHRNYLNSFVDKFGNIWLFWSTYEYSANVTVYKLWFKMYSASANSWGADTLITTGTSFLNIKHLADNNGNIWLFWVGGGNFWYKKYTSSATGGSWGIDTQIPATKPNKIYIDSFVDKAGNIWLFWRAYEGEGYNFGYTMYSASWGQDTLVPLPTATSKTYKSFFEDSAGNIWFFWTDSNGKLWHNRISSSGWGTDTEVKTFTAAEIHNVNISLVEESAGIIWLFWNLPYSTDNNFRYKIYNGKWGADIPVTTTTTANKIYIRLLKDQNRNIWLFWQTIQGGNSSSRYNKYSAGNWDEQQITVIKCRYYINSFEDRAGNIWLLWIDSNLFWCRKYSAGIWEADRQITTDTATTANKTYITSFEDRAGNIWLFWGTYDPTGSNLWCNRYDASSDSWGTDTQLTVASTVTSPNYLKSFEDSAGNIWLFWSVYEGGISKLMCKKSTGDGNWEAADKQLNTVTFNFMNAFEDKNGNIWVSWGEAGQLQYTKYIPSAAGGNWGTNETVPIVPTTYIYGVYSFEDRAGNIWFLWMQDNNLWCKRYFASIHNWGPDTQLITGTTGKNYSYTLVDKGGNIWLFWYTYEYQAGGTLYSLWCKKYNINGGGNWEADTQLDTPSVYRGGFYGSLNPFADSAGNIWLFWSNYENGFFSFWCKRYSPITGSWITRQLVTGALHGYNKSFEDHEGNIWFLYPMPDYDNIWCKRYVDIDWLAETRLTSGLTYKRLLNSFEDKAGNIWLFWVVYQSHKASFCCKKCYASI